MKFSVLMSVYWKENAQFLNAALSSIESQTLQPDEIVIVHDGPLTDELYACIDFFKNRLNIVELKLKTNFGLGAALKIGLENCNYEFVIRCDSDDINRPDRFEKQILFLMHNPFTSLVSAYIEEFNVTCGDLSRLRRVPIGKKQIQRSYLYRNPINHMAAAFRKSHILSVGSYEHMPFFEDYYLWVKVIRAGFIIENMSDVLVLARVGNGMLDRRKGISYIVNEIKFYRAVAGLKKTATALVYFFMGVRVLFRLLPVRLLGLVYTSVRGKKNDNKCNYSNKG